MQGFLGEFRYLLGRVGMVVLLLLVSILLFVAGLVIGGWLFVLLIQGYVGS